MEYVPDLRVGDRVRARAELLPDAEGSCIEYGEFGVVRSLHLDDRFVVMCNFPEFSAYMARPIDLEKVEKIGPGFAVGDRVNCISEIEFEDDLTIPNGTAGSVTRLEMDFCSAWVLFDGFEDEDSLEVNALLLRGTDALVFEELDAPASVGSEQVGSSTPDTAARKLPSAQPARSVNLDVWKKNFMQCLQSYCREGMHVGLVSSKPACQTLRKHDSMEVRESPGKGRGWFNGGDGVIKPYTNLLWEHGLSRPNTSEGMYETACIVTASDKLRELYVPAKHNMKTPPPRGTSTKEFHDAIGRILGNSFASKGTTISLQHEGSFFNHSWKPNAWYKFVTLDGMKDVFVVLSIRDIPLAKKLR